MDGSFALLLVVLTPPVELGGKPVESPLPDGPVRGHELRELAKRLRAERVQPSPSRGPNDHEVGVFQDRQLPRDTRLPDIDHLYQLVDRAFSLAEGVDQSAPGRVGQDLEYVGHDDIL